MFLLKSNFISTCFLAFAAKLTNSILLKTKKEADLYNSQFLLVSIPTKSQVTYHSSTVAGTNTEYDIELPDKIIGSFCKENNIKFLPFLSYFRDYWRQTKKSLFWEHFNLEGHKLAASVISDYLTKNQIIPSQTFFSNNNDKEKNLSLKE